MDKIDRRILRELQQDASLSNVELARRYASRLDLRAAHLIDAPEHAAVREALDAVANSEVLDDSLDIARDYVKRANEAISFLPESDTKRCMIDLGEYVLSRRS